VKAKCYNHSNKDALSVCHACGSHFCSDCLTAGAEYYYCDNAQCQAALQGELSKDVGEKQVAKESNPALGQVNSDKHSKKAKPSQIIFIVLGLICFAGFFIAGFIATGGMDKPMPGWTFTLLFTAIVFLLLGVLPELAAQIKRNRTKAEKDEKLLPQKETSKVSNDKRRKVIEICLPNGEIKEFKDISQLREEIMGGSLKKDYKSRIKGSKEVKWSTLEKIAKTDFKLQALYKPIWAYTMQFLLSGAIVGIILKALDTTWLFFQIDPKVAFIWLIIVASLFVSKWWNWAPVVAIVISITSGIKGNLFLAVFSVMIVGAIFGAPAGMIVGTIIGHFKKRNFPKAADAVAEGARPYLIGLLAPVIFLGITFPFYLFWLNPKILAWLSNSP